MKKKYKKGDVMPIIQDSEEYFPNRRLVTKEKKLLIAQIIRYTSTDISNTMPPEDRVNAKLADSNIINRFIENCPDRLAEEVFVNLGAQIRMSLTRNPKTLGIAQQHRPADIDMGLLVKKKPN